MSWKKTRRKINWNKKVKSERKVLRSIEGRGYIYKEEWVRGDGFIEGTEVRVLEGVTLNGRGTKVGNGRSDEQEAINGEE